MTPRRKQPAPKQPDPSDCLDSVLLDEDTQEALQSDAEGIVPEDHQYHE